MKKNNKRTNSARMIIGAFALIALLTPFVYEEIATDFTVENISYPLAYDASKEIPALSETKEQWLKTFLSQHFKWIGQGHQVHVFESEDKKYVLKIFKFKRLKPSSLQPYLERIPIVGSHFHHLEKIRVSRFKKLFDGYHLAYMADQPFTRVHYVHLNLTHYLQKEIHVLDRLGRHYNLDADSTIFAIQEKAVMTKSLFKQLLNQDNREKVKEKIRLLLDMYVTEYKQGIYDRDIGIMQNTGFIGDQPIRLDIGQLKQGTPEDPAFYQINLMKVTDRIDQWLHKYYPLAADEICRDMSDKLRELDQKRK